MCNSRKSTSLPTRKGNAPMGVEDHRGEEKPLFLLGFRDVEECR